MTGRAGTSRLQLPPQQPTRLPFSSPIGEEILSPTSPEVTRKQPVKGGIPDPFTSPPLDLQDPFSDTGGDLTSHSHNFVGDHDGTVIRRDIHNFESRAESRPHIRATRPGGSSVHRGRYSVDKPSRDKSKKRHLKEFGRSQRPGLNLITNFAKPLSTAVRAADMKSDIPQQDSRVRENRYRGNAPGRPPVRPGLPTQHSGFVSLADLKALTSQHPASRPAPFPLRRAVTEGSYGIETRGDSASLSVGPVINASKPAQRSNQETGEHKIAGVNMKHEKVAGLGFRLSDLSQSGPEEDDSCQSEISDQESSASAEFSGISPSDRPIVIGIAVPSTRLAEFALSPQSATPVSGLRNKTTPLTPTIVVTPAKKEAPWSFSPKDSKSSNTRRPISSFYSQATPYVASRAGEEDIPPVPALATDALYGDKGSEPLQSEPDDVSMSSTLNLSEIWAEKERGKNSPTDQVLDEDNEVQLITRGRSFSGINQLGIMGRASVDSVSTGHGSRGWWNVITSPFLTRSNTMMSRRSPVDPTPRPEIPSIAQAATMAEKQERTDHVEKESSSFGICSPRIKSGHTSIWTDTSEWEAQRRGIGVALDHTPSASTIGRPPYHQTQESSATIPFVMVGGVHEGAAAEYYQVCTHDQNNTNPFYECINHTCLSDSQQPLHDESLPTQEEQGLRVPVPLPLASNNPFFQEPSDRFAAEFRQALSPRARADSDTTEIDEDADISPNVHEAIVAPIVRAPFAVGAPTRRTSQGAISVKDHTNGIPAIRDVTPMRILMAAPTTREMPLTSPPGPPPYSPPRRTTKFPRYMAVMPPGREPYVRQQQPQSPGPVTPGLQQAMSSRGGIPMAEVNSSAPAVENHIHITNNYPSYTSATTRAQPITLADLEPPSEMQSRNELRRQRLEREDALAKKTGGLWRGRGCLSSRGCYGKSGPAGRTRRRWYCGLTATLVAMIILIVGLATTLTRKGDRTPVESQWLNITGYPPIPTGISTIAQPDAVKENSGCVQPATLWSCALPKELHQSVVPNDPDQPNFRVQIRFRNGTAPGNRTNKVKRSHDPRASPVSASFFIRGRALRIRDAFTDALYSPLPAPPKPEDQIFLGNSTDSNIAPFEGESTPFFITFLSPILVPSSRLLKRQDTSATNTTDSFPNLGNAIPPPEIGQDGSAAATNLLPLPVSQPLRIYNRGLPTEHYGFYNYFDRSTFSNTVGLLNSSGPNSGNAADDENGGAAKNGARIRCTWAQTRFLVQIWTNQGNAASLLSSPNATTTASTSPSTSRTASNASNSSANNFNRPGSFPYPVTITLDRHGGDITRKMIYCYGMDDRGRPIATEKKLQLETRDFGGSLVNPALGPFGHVNVSIAEGGPGGIDGGTGGCACQWRNFQTRR
ncbi:hypothetical protein MMC16_001243 [Acarospora aff. strigata]|nr:hypothetical protein [Acarospora aff. strigata]